MIARFAAANGPRRIVTGTSDNGGYVWGPNAADIQEYALRCRWPEATEPADDWSAARAVGDSYNRGLSED